MRVQDSLISALLIKTKDQTHPLVSILCLIRHLKKLGSFRDPKVWYLNRCSKLALGHKNLELGVLLVKSTFFGYVWLFTTLIKFNLLFRNLFRAFKIKPITLVAAVVLQFWCEGVFGEMRKFKKLVTWNFKWSLKNFNYNISRT